MAFFKKEKETSIDINETKKPQKRFIIKETCEPEFCMTVKVLVDTKTGVNYMILDNGTTHIIPLLDSDGEVLVDYE